MKQHKHLMNTYKEVKTERHLANRKYKKLSRGSHKNGTIGVEFPLEGHSVVYDNQNIQKSIKKDRDHSDNRLKSK
jgi:hypothetical protein